MRSSKGPERTGVESTPQTNNGETAGLTHLCNMNVNPVEEGAHTIDANFYQDLIEVHGVENVIVHGRIYQNGELVEDSDGCSIFVDERSWLSNMER